MLYSHAQHTQMTRFTLLCRLVVSVALLGSLAAMPVSASPPTVLTTLHSCLPTGYNPLSTPVLGSDGTLYGAASVGGCNNKGTIYRVSPGGVFTTLYHFSALNSSNHNTDGTTPYGNLILSSDGTVLYGTAYAGGANNNGTIFKINTDGTGFTPLHSFTSATDGSSPRGILALSGSTLYGTTYVGGTNSNGTIFKIGTDGTGYTVLRNLTSATDGANPYGGLTLSGSMLYGATSNGGTNSNGTIFKIGTDGTGFTVLRNLMSATDGANPYASLTLSGSTLYGTAINGGPNSGSGTIFKINTDGTGFTPLHSFTSATDGAAPRGTLALSGSTLYGTTYVGGTNVNGTIFKIGTDGTGFTVLRNLTSATDGTSPIAGVACSSTTLYGACNSGGLNNKGTLFKIGTDGTAFTVLQTCAVDAAYPQSPILPMSDTGVTTLFGTGLKGGAGYGLVFRMTTAGSPTLNSTLNFGRYQCSGLTSDGNPTSTANLYGTCEYTSTGTAGGTAFYIGPNFISYSYYTLTAAATGAYSTAGLTRIGTNYYGAAMGGGANGKGTLFQRGTFAALYSFNTTDGAYPCGTLTASADGLTLYGTTLQGGANGKGTLFAFTIAGGTLTTLYSFNTTDGAYPECALALSGTTLYGTTVSGGANGKGTLFQVSTTGTNFADLHDFTGTDGRLPIAGPTIGSNGLLYGTTVYGGVHGLGTVYSFNPTGNVFASLYSFSGLDGSIPVASLAEDPNAPGTFYGTTEYGGSANFGSVYSIVP